MLIRRLDPILIDQIAAGEVIERPAAAVKELVENAIDAKASRIDIRIEQGGRRLIRIIDDGIGMGPDDLALAIERHATSKLPDGSLERVSTLGFRGEALPSIGAVARLTITSRPRSPIEQGPEGIGREKGGSAHLIRVDAGRVEPVRPAAFGMGTRIEVEDLFHATPARLKFLKGDRAEAQAAALVVKRLAMANPAIGFSLQGDHLTGLDLPAEAVDGEGNARRIARILGKDFRENAMPVSGQRGAMRLSGLVSVPTFHRASALDQYLFVNGRPVRDKLLIGALRAAYADTITAGRYPVVALFLDLDPALVDVNVHPAKLEVRFRENEAVRSLIIGAIRDALASAGHHASTRGGQAMLARLQSHGLTHIPERPLSFAFPTGYPAAAPMPAPMPAPAVPSGFAEAAHAAMDVMAEVAVTETAFPPLGFARAQFHETYILAQTAEGVVIVDQHAAHERLVYERLKAARASGGIARQPLLIPAIVDLDEAVIAALLDIAPALAEAGLVVEPFGPGALAVQEIPAALAGADITRLVRNLAESLEDWGGAESLEARYDCVLKTFACHHSIRAGRRMKLEEMDALLREMEGTPGSGQCNHGRPTYIALGLRDIERLFGRS
ncbi:MAG: DNA mismatch repair protein [Beijerinckiaceae bacterium]|nr:MAG: DNA mismatch repair protein [Beijerinckiaceae bacterium]